MSDLLDLAARCEAAEGADRELDALIAQAVGAEYGKKSGWCNSDDGDHWVIDECAAAYTASLDAAMTLVPEGYFACVLNAGGAQSSAPTQGRGTAICTPWGDIVRGDPVEAATPALALCAAALRARAA